MQNKDFPAGLTRCAPGNTHAEVGAAGKTCPYVAYCKHCDSNTLMGCRVYVAGKAAEAGMEPARWKKRHLARMAQRDDAEAQAKRKAAEAEYYDNLNKITKERDRDIVLAIADVPPDKRCDWPTASKWKKHTCKCDACKAAAKVYDYNALRKQREKTKYAKKLRELEEGQ